jgi:hypothetical protein
MDNDISSLASLRKDTVISRLCSLCSYVAETEFNNSISSDCFCNVKQTDSNVFYFDEKILEYIEDAVFARLRRHNK